MTQTTTDTPTLRVLRPLRAEERAAKLAVREMIKQKILKAQDIYDRLCRELEEGVTE